jgi:hypothetical protein
MTMIHVRLPEPDHIYISRLASVSGLSIARTVAALVQDARRREITELTIRPGQP